MRAVILIGGKGERLMPLTENTRKAYLPLGNKRVIDHIIERLPKGMPYSISENNIGATAAIAEALEGSEPIMVICGDNYFSESFDGFIQAYHGAVLVGVYNVKTKREAREFGVVKLDSMGQLEEIIEKPTRPQTTLVSTGLYIFPPIVFGLTKDFASSHPSSGIGNLLGHIRFVHYSVYGYLFTGVWIDIGTPESYQRAQDIVK